MTVYMPIEGTSLVEDVIPGYLLRPTIESFSRTWEKAPEIFKPTPTDDLASHTYTVKLVGDKLSLDRELSRKINHLFIVAKSIVFEDGMGNEFMHCLVDIVKTHGNAAVNLIGNAIMQNALGSDVASIVLRYLGEINQPTTYRTRLSLLIEALGHRSPRIRDGATLGISSMDDPVAIPYLKLAIKNEILPDLRNDIQLVLAQLEERG